MIIIGRRRKQGSEEEGVTAFENHNKLLLVCLKQVFLSLEWLVASSNQREMVFLFNNYFLIMNLEEKTCTHACFINSFENLDSCTFKNLHLTETKRERCKFKTARFLVANVLYYYPMVV
jgi:hypothetical protein